MENLKKNCDFNLGRKEVDSWAAAFYARCSLLHSFAALSISSF